MMRVMQVIVKSRELFAAVAGKAICGSASTGGDGCTIDREPFGVIQVSTGLFDANDSL
jgi:hypothetical protein